MDTEKLPNNTVEDLQPVRENKLDSFEPATNEEVMAILKKLPNKTCSLDPVPTWLVIKCCEELCPSITSIVNSSLAESDMPSLLKKAIVKPLLKKTGLNQDDLKNYRPVSNLGLL